MSVDIISPTTLDRLLDSFRKIVRAEFPQLTFMGIWEYSVQATDGVTIDCSPTDTAIPLPSLAKVPMISGLLGELATPVIGKRCVIIFLNGDPTKARCLSIDGSNEHAMTTEATALLIYNTLGALFTAGSATPLTAGAAPLLPLISAALVVALQTQGAAAPAGVQAQNVAAAAQSALFAAGGQASSCSPFVSAISGLPAKTPNLSGLFPGVGATK